MTSPSPLPIESEEEIKAVQELPTQTPENESLLMPLDHDDQQFIKGYN